jgi:hypothetical protein
MPTISLLFLLAALVYAALIANKIHSSTGGVSMFGIVVTLLGLIAGWLLQRFLPVAGAGDGWESSRVTRVAVEILFSFVAAITFLAVTLIKRDVDVRTNAGSSPQRALLLIPLFLFAVGVAARAKLAAFLVALFSKASQ